MTTWSSPLYFSFLFRHSRRAAPRCKSACRGKRRWEAIWYYDDTMQYCVATAAMATSFFKHVTRPVVRVGFADERWGYERRDGEEGERVAAPGRNCCWKLPRGVALAKAVSRAGFRTEVYRFPVRPPGERKYRWGCKGRVDSPPVAREGEINELPRMNEKFRGKMRF